ncbi:hypothetical protein HaLaN_20209 [Haematococcus lacustris]|uniref:Uncharacterized protein n=1 Tax=Haematococcus lacustris TaxID=44745 RepID=A0A6A0A1A1_HAELA|nr:hypothetical protein HaLaN_20209 [Haematococcus lacustris]
MPAQAIADTPQLLTINCISAAGSWCWCRPWALPTPPAAPPGSSWQLVLVPPLGCPPLQLSSRGPQRSWKRARHASGGRAGGIGPNMSSKVVSTAYEGVKHRSNLACFRAWVEGRRYTGLACHVNRFDCGDCPSLCAGAPGPRWSRRSLAARPA